MPSTPKKIKFADLSSERVPLVELELMEGVYQLYPPSKMNTSCYTRYVGASRIISQTIKERDKQSRLLISNINGLLEAKAKEGFTFDNLHKFITELKEQLLPADKEDDEDEDEDDKEGETSLETPEISDKKKFTNLVERYFNGSILEDILGFYEEYNFEVTVLFTSPEYIGYMNEAIEAAFNLPEGITANWGLEQLREMQKTITEAINAHAKEEKKKEREKKKAKKALNQIKAAEPKAEPEPEPIKK